MIKTITKILVGFIILCVFSQRGYAQGGVGITYGLTVSGAPVAPTFTNAVTAATGADESKVIFTAGGFSMPFAGATYPLILVSTNGWAALLPASDLSASVAASTNSAAIAANATTITLTSAAGVVPGMYVSGAGILGGTSYAQVLNVVGNVITINVGCTAVVAGAGNYNFYNLLPAYFATALPANGLATYAGARPMIAPLWDDLACAILSYNITGGVYTIKWTGKWDKTNASAGLNFFLSLNSATGNIVFNYPNVTYTPFGAPSASIGIAGVCTGDYYSVNPLTATTATFDSTFEYSNITGTPRLNATTLTWNPYCANDNCSGVRPARDLGTITSSCTFATFSNVNATTSGSAICSTTDVRDVWFKFTKPASVANIKISTAAALCNSAPGTTIELFSSCGGASLGCATTSTANPNFGELIVNRPCTLEVLYIRVTADGDVTSKFQLCVSDQGSNLTGINNGATCTTATNICSLPFNVAGMNTAGFGNEYDSANSACHDPYMNGEDYVFAYTPTANSCIQIQLTSAGTNPSIFVFDGCPNSGLTHCVSSVAGTTGIIRINSISLIAGVTYYIVIDNNPLNATNNIPFDLSVVALGTSQTYDDCATAYNMGSIANNTACVFGTYSTECSSPSPTAGLPAPGCGNMIDGVTGDVWLKFTATFSGSLLVKTQPSFVNPTQDAAMAIYTGTCGAFTLFACDDNSAGNSLPLLSIPVTNGVTYYIRVWTVNPANTGNFDLCLSSACSPPNDLPCSAVLVPMGGTAAGFNTCAGSNNEPANAAQCTIGGIINTVWYKTVVPASGSIKIRTHPLTLTDTQIQAFTFAATCTNAATTFVNKGCNDDGPDCGTQNNQSYHDYSELTITGQTPGDTIFIAVDGFNSQTGTFEITVVDGTTASYAPVYMQDCDFPYEVCGPSNIVTADPGPLNFGNICDFQPTYDCWQNGERNSLWYRVTVNPGTLQFAINSVTDYDFIMWDVTGVANACASIQNHTLPSIRCNWVTTTGQTGISIPDPNASWEPAITAVSTRTYLILIDNWNPPNFVTGFNLDWMGSPIASNPTSVTWNGSVDTSFSSTTNWGTAPCNALPSCTIDAIITTTASGRQPTMTVNTQVKNLVINSGATLRIKTGVILDVCGDFTNNGTLIAEPGCTVRFSGTGLQTINGSLTGTNAFAHLTIFKASGSVVANSNIEAFGNFTTVSATSIFNINGKTLRLGGNFSNSTANTTFTNVSGSTVEFNGSIDQYFTNTTGALELYHVKMNKTGGKLYENSANSRITVEGVLTLTQGIIVPLSTLDVYVKNNAPGAIVGHNANSYIQGKLRRSMYSLISAATNTVTTVIGGNTITLSSVAGLLVGHYVFGAGFPGWCQVTSIVGNVVTLSSNITAVAGVGSSFNYASIPATAIALPYSLDYPVGDSLTPGGYELANITFTSGTVIPDITGSFGPWPGMVPPALGPTASECLYATYDALSPFNHGYWTFSKTAPSPFNGVYRMTLYNNGQTNNSGMGWTVAKADIAANPSLNASWSLIGQCVITSTAGNTQRVNINTPANTATSFNALFTTVQSTQPLPIELLYFNAEPDGETVTCKWETASETNNDFFEVQRSMDGDDWTVIGTVRGFGAGTSTINHLYKFIDPDKCKGIRYYRLRQVDIDEHFGFSETIAINCKGDINDISVYPNPGSENIIYSFYEETKGQALVEFIDMLGKVVKSELISTQKGYNPIHADVTDLANGVYYLRVKSVENSAQADRQIRFVKE